MWQRVSALTNSAADVAHECVCRADEFALSAGVWSWSGTFAKPGAAAGVGPMYLCEGEDGVVQGSYAGLGIIQGVASGNMLRGSWYEAGEGSGSMASHGEVVFTMYRANSSNSVWLVGEWTYGFGSSAVRSTSEWRTMRMSTAVPTARQCFSSTVVGSVLTNGGWAESAPLASWDARLAGRFTVMAGDPPAVFDLCPRSDGSTVGSYTWSLDGNAGMSVARLLTACSLRLTCLCVCWSFGVLLCTVRSYQTGTCFGGAVLCSGVFHDEYSDGSTASGIWLTIRTSSGQSGSYQALDTWWYGTAADLDLSKLGDSTYQGEDEQVLSGLSGDCSANADVGVAASNAQFALWTGVFSDSVEVRCANVWQCVCGSLTLRCIAEWWIRGSSLSVCRHGFHDCAGHVL